MLDYSWAGWGWLQAPDLLTCRLFAVLLLSDTSHFTTHCVTLSRGYCCHTFSLERLGKSHEIIYLMECMYPVQSSSDSLKNMSEKKLLNGVDDHYNVHKRL